MGVRHWGLSYDKSPQISKALFSILADLNNTVALIISACPPISNSFGPFTNPLGIVSYAPITIGIIVTSIAFLIFWQCPLLFFAFRTVARRESPLFVRFYYYFFFLRFISSFLFYFCYLLSGLVIWSRINDLFASQNATEFYASHSPAEILVCAYTIW